MALRSVTAKLGTMRKAVEWTVYPLTAGATSVIIQSDHRIAEFDLTTGKGLLSRACSGGAYFIHLNPILGATPMDAPPALLAEILGAVPKSGEEIGPGVYVA